jgi:hypothetical protein
MKKLLATTALAAVALSGVSFAEIKVSGSIEQTITSTSFDKAADEVSGGTTIGSEVNLGISGSKTLDNGMVVSSAFRLENNGAAKAPNVDQKSLKITNGNFAVELGIDTGDNITGNVVANVGQQAEDMSFGADKWGADSLSASDTHDLEHIGLSYNTSGGKFTVNYSPDSSASQATNSHIETGKSSTEFVFNGSLGVPGLAVKVGRQTTESVISTAGDVKEDVIGAMYKYGKFAVAYTDRSQDDDTVATEKDNVKSYSVSYNVADNVSVAYERMETSTIGQANDEEIDHFGISYNMGGLGIEAYFAQISNIAGDSTRDADTMQLRTVFAY